MRKPRLWELLLMSTLASTSTANAQTCNVTQKADQYEGVLAPRELGNLAQDVNRAACSILTDSNIEHKYHVDATYPQMGEWHIAELVLSIDGVEIKYGVVNNKQEHDSRIYMILTKRGKRIDFSDSGLDARFNGFSVNQGAKSGNFDLFARQQTFDHFGDEQFQRLLGDSRYQFFLDAVEAHYAGQPLPQIPKFQFSQAPAVDAEAANLERQLAQYFLVERSHYDDPIYWFGNPGVKTQYSFNFLDDSIVVKFNIAYDDKRPLMIVVLNDNTPNQEVFRDEGMTGSIDKALLKRLVDYLPQIRSGSIKVTESF